MCTLIILSTTSFACVGPSPIRLTEQADYMVVVNTVRLPDTMDWYTRFAEHAWIDVKQGNEASWTRIEIGGPSSGIDVFHITSAEVRAPIRWKNRVSVLETITGERAKLAIPQLLRLAAAEKDFGTWKTVSEKDNNWHAIRHPAQARDYDAWPGPNSNTFIATLIEGTPELHAELHHNSVGKDYPRSMRAGMTSSGYGFEADLGYLGAGIGLRQGLELHFMQLTAGIGLWPPALKIPLIPRIGIHQGWIGAAGSLEKLPIEPEPTL
ncbi:MAG: hypothetical protein COA70_11425 [Planctomycetota bacterium]|nr:MAG: hypothetical protein COA70_11425 [Planctomycetota bacterium]